MPRPSSEEKIHQWKRTILKQKESGLSVNSWCHQNDISVPVFYYWKTKLSPKPALGRSAFSELSDDKECSEDKKGGIIIEYHGARILVDRQFDPFTLKQCLKLLKEVKC